MQHRLDYMFFVHCTVLEDKHQVCGGQVNLIVNNSTSILCLLFAYIQLDSITATKFRTNMITRSEPNQYENSHLT